MELLGFHMIDYGEAVEKDGRLECSFKVGRDDVQQYNTMV